MPKADPYVYFKEKLLILAENPSILKNNIKKLSGTKEGCYRLRVGSYRIIKRDKELIILIIRIGHRREIHQ